MGEEGREEAGGGVSGGFFALVVAAFPFVIGAVALTLGIPAAVIVTLVPLYIAATRGNQIDAVSILVAFAFLVLLIPATQVFTPLKSVGSPATILAVIALWLWVMGLLIPGLKLARGPQPIRVLVLVWGAVNLVSIIAAQIRSIDATEIAGGDRGVVMTLSAMGAALLAADGITSRRRLEILIRRIVQFATVVAGMGVLEFVTGFRAADLIRLPGLGPLDVAEFSDDRSGFARIAVTGTHAIELSVVMCMVVPLALYLAFNDRGRHRRWWWASVALIAACIPMTVSRSGFVGLAAVLVVLLPAWPRVRRRRAIVGVIAYLAAMRVLFPGLLGTIKALFLHLGNDPSATSRSKDYGFIGDFFSQSPVVGRGLGTFIPTRYDFIDNQYLLTLVEVGLVGVVAYAALWVGGMLVARRTRAEASDDATRDLTQALVASLAVVAVTSATFDFLGFSMARNLAFLLLGCVGALWRLERHKRVLLTRPALGPAPATTDAS